MVAWRWRIRLTTLAQGPAVVHLAHVPPRISLAVNKLAVGGQLAWRVVADGGTRGDRGVRSRDPVTRRRVYDASEELAGERLEVG